MQNNSFTTVLQRAIESTTTGVVIVDYLAKDMPLIYVNPVFEKLTGYSAEECVGKNCRFLQGPKTDKNQVRQVREALEKGVKCKIPLLNYTKSGSTFWNELSLAPVRDQSGRITHYIGIQDDISLRIESQEMLLKAKMSAEEANRLKTEFLNIISHELRTPLTVMLGNLPLLKDPGDMPDFKEISEIAQDIEDSGLHLLELINELLDISKIEEGRLKLEMENLLIKSCINDAVSSIKSLAENKGLVFELALRDFSFQGDPIRIKQILINLLGNSVKFTDQGSIRITSYTEDNIGIVKIKDTGCGIEEKFLPYVFDVFRRADGSATRSRSGSGLGLAITKKLVDLHGGSISVSSVYQKGSEFAIHFPLKES